MWCPPGVGLGTSSFLDIYLPNISDLLQFFLFADDTNIYYEAESPEKLELVINKELKKLQAWLALNIDKTNFIVFHPYNKPMKPNITLKF